MRQGKRTFSPCGGGGRGGGRGDGAGGGRGGGAGGGGGAGEGSRSLPLSLKIRGPRLPSPRPLSRSWGRKIT